MPNYDDATDPSVLIDAIISDLDDWRGQRLAQIRKLIHDADPDIIEEVKWRKPSNPNGVPVWSHDGIICTGETYKDKVKLTFAQGASLPDPTKLFNSSLEGKVRRAIDIHEADTIDADAIKDLVQAAIDHNQSLPRAGIAGAPLGSATARSHSTHGRTQR